jgi:hypothetical protein
MAACGLFERLLRRLGQHALARSLDRVPERLAYKAAGNVFSAAPHPGDLESSVRLLGQLCCVGSRPSDALLPKTLMGKRQKRANRVADMFVELTSLERGERQRRFELTSSVNRKLSVVSNWLTCRLTEVWSRRSVAREPERERFQTIVLSSAEAVSSPSTSTWDEDAELFVLLQLSNLIREAFAHIQNLLTFLVLMLLLVVSALNSYPFKPQRLIMVLSFALVFWVVGSILIAIVKFNRDSVLSRLANSTPNQLTFDRSLLMPLVTYVVLPLLSLVAVQFSEVSQSLFSWMGFVQKALHG